MREAQGVPLVRVDRGGGQAALVFDWNRNGEHVYVGANHFAQKDVQPVRLMWFHVAVPEKEVGYFVTGFEVECGAPQRVEVKRENGTRERHMFNRCGYAGLGERGNMRVKVVNRTVVGGVADEEVDGGSVHGAKLLR